MINKLKQLDSMEIVGGTILLSIFTYGVVYVFLELVKRFYCNC